MAQSNDRDANAAPDAAPKAGTQNNTEKRFDILEYVVDGNSVLSVPDIEEAVYPFLGESRNAADVDQARDALEQVYQSRGFQTVQVEIPQQSIDSGIIHLQVVENPVGRLRVVNSKYHSLSEIKATAPSVAEGTVLNMPQVQNDIVALNQNPDLRVTPRLVAGRAPGTVDVELQVEDHLPLHASVELNNQYNQNTRPLRTVASVSYDNLWQLGHSINLSYQIAPQDPDNAKVLSGSYLFRLPESAVSFLLYGVHSDSNVAAIAGTDVVGKGNIFGARAIVNLPGDATFFQSITAGIDRKSLSQNVVTGGIPSNAPVLYYPMTLAYAATLQQGDATTQADASLNVALPMGSASNKFDAQRFNSLRQYVYLKADLSRSQPLPWGFVAYGKIDGQITPDPLLSSEQMSAGGANTVRGYLEAESLGDYGAHSTVELRTPSVGNWISPRINDWHFLAFVDGAALWLREPLAEQKASFVMSSVGIGTRLKAMDVLNAAADFAVPLLDSAATRAGDYRVHFRLWSEF